ncbi:MAG: hypothetical protein QW390_03480 [Candidatus Bathyarchaeia archaeon]
MAEESEERQFLRPIINASYPATLAALSLAVLQIAGQTGPRRIVLGSGALMFTICAFTFFFYSIYPTRRAWWTATAVTFIIGLAFTLVSVLTLIFAWVD